MLLYSANGISAIYSILTKNITTRLVRTYRCTRTRRSRVPSRLSVSRWRCRFWADYTTNISERKFPTWTAAPNQRRNHVSWEGGGGRRTRIQHSPPTPVTDHQQDATARREAATTCSALTTPTSMSHPELWPISRIDPSAESIIPEI